MLLLCGLSIAAASSPAGEYENFDVAIYIPVGVVQRFEDPDRLRREWQRIRSQLKVDKVYIEVQRDRNLASDELLDQVKRFFVDQGIEVAGGMALSDGSVGGQFRSFCYTNVDDRKFIQNAVELAARHFDEVIQDDFFFVTTKSDSDIAAKGDRSWTEFRLDLLRDAAENLLIKPAKAVNPNVKMVIKFPNWYEHFQGLGFDLDIEPKLFDGIYAGTETRDPEITDQNLQQYESYLIVRYFENIKPGFPVRLDGPSHVALFAYDNNTFVVQSFRDEEADVTVSVLDTQVKQLRNLVTNVALNSQPLPPGPDRREFGRRRGPSRERRTAFTVHIPAHSYLAFAAEK